MTMMDSDPANLPLTSQLKEIQDELINQLGTESYYLLPPPSFHQTIANTLSDTRFKKFIQETGLER